MHNLSRRLKKAEKQLCIGEKPYPINIAGIEMMSDEFKKLIRKIQAESKRIPVKS